MNCATCGDVSCPGSVGLECRETNDIYTAVRYFRDTMKPQNIPIGTFFDSELDPNSGKIWNGKGFQAVNTTPDESIVELTNKFRDQYLRGFKDGHQSARQVISGELSEVREYLLTLTDDDTSFEKRERMLKAVISVLGTP